MPVGDSRTGEPTRVGDFLAGALEKSNTYKWIEAARLYGQALKTIDAANDSTETFRILELQSKCYYKGAFQASTREEFCEVMRLAQQLHEQVGKIRYPQNPTALSNRARSNALFAHFWLEDSSDERRALVETSVSVASEAAQLLLDSDDKRYLAQTRKNILTYSRESLLLSTEWKHRYPQFKTALEVGRQAIADFEALGEKEGALETLHDTLWVLAVEAQLILKPADFASLSKETIQLGNKIAEIAHEINTPEALSLANEARGDIAWDVEGEISKSFQLYESALLSARETRDSATIGRLLTIMAGLQHWQGMDRERIEERREVIEKGLRFANDAMENLRISLHTGYLARAHSCHASCYIDLADFAETDPSAKRAMLAKAVETASQGMTYETHTVGWRQSAHEASKAMYFLALMEENHFKKKDMLDRALQIREGTVAVTDALQPHSWNSGVMRNYRALIKTDLAKLENEPLLRTKLLEDAVLDSKECLELCTRWPEISGSAQRLARYSEWYGDTLHQLYRARKEPAIGESGLKAYIDAIEYLDKLQHFGPVPAIRWKVAKLHDDLGQLKQASQEFLRAADDYRRAAGKTPVATAIFQELARYMEAWAEMENGRLHHIHEEFEPAYDSYATAAKYLAETPNWSYLSRVCEARSLLEEGEESSRAENHIASIESMGSALRAFAEAKKELKERLSKTESTLEKPELKNWLKIVTQRELYCHGRVELEEARVSEKKGEKTASSDKYRSAALTFEALAAGDVSISDRAEYQTLAQFCDALARMKEAELRADPELFAVAAESFLKAKESSTRDRFRFLALANASICRALEAGTRFRLNRDTQLYSQIKKHLEAAADWYYEAGLKKTGTWTRATQRLFDALVYLTEGEMEKDPKKKAEFYNLAEKHFEIAAKLYGEAGFPVKKEEALRDLGRAREERRLLLSTIEAIAEIPSVSGASITSLTLKGGPALGLERFEEANLMGNLTVPERDLQVGTNLTFELEVANVGKATATLMKLENIVPDGFEMDRENNPFRIEGSIIDLRGKRLDHLKMHEMKLVLRPVQRGTFALRPRVLFADDKGTHRWYDFQPVTLTVRELGLSGWIRRRGKEKPPLETASEPPRLEERHAPLSAPLAFQAETPSEFRFETDRAKDVFQHLVTEFLKDYMSKRLYVERAGWRSLMEIVHETGIPRSAVYGPGGRSGPVLQELERRGLIETRIFPEERGRGGEITKVRVAYDNEIVKRIVEKMLMDNP